MIEVIFDPDDITIHACSSIQLDYSTDEDGKPSVSHDDGGEGVSLEEEKSRMVLLLGSLNKGGGVGGGGGGGGGRGLSNIGIEGLSPSKPNIKRYI